MAGCPACFDQELIVVGGGCSTFRPQINAAGPSKTTQSSVADRLYELAKSREEACAKELSWEERELQQCTFKPVINTSRPTTSMSPPSTSAAMKKHVERLRQSYSPEQASSERIRQPRSERLRQTYSPEQPTSAAQDKSANRPSSAPQPPRRTAPSNQERQVILSLLVPSPNSTRKRCLSCCITKEQIRHF